MKISPREIELAKKAIALSQRVKPGMTEEDISLLRKYPLHTLAAARLIDSEPLQPPIRGCRCAFDLIRRQETSNHRISGQHT